MKNQHPLSETEREDAFHVAKKAHEQERELTLFKIPIATKQWYGQIGFVLWKYPRKAKRVVRVHLPVLILGPYDVPPYHRKRWDKAKDKENKVHAYWYNDRAISVLPCASIKSYDEGLAEGLHKIPVELLRRRCDGGGSSPSGARAERTFLSDWKKALAAMEEDAMFQPHERKFGLGHDILEDYEKKYHVDEDRWAERECEEPTTSLAAAVPTVLPPTITVPPSTNETPVGRHKRKAPPSRHGGAAARKSDIIDKCRQLFPTLQEERNRPLEVAESGDDDNDDEDNQYFSARSGNRASDDDDDDDDEADSFSDNGGDDDDRKLPALPASVLHPIGASAETNGDRTPPPPVVGDSDAATPAALEIAAAGGGATATPQQNRRGVVKIEPGSCGSCSSGSPVDHPHRVRSTTTIMADLSALDEKLQRAERRGDILIILQFLEAGLDSFRRELQSPYSAAAAQSTAYRALTWEGRGAHQILKVGASLRRVIRDAQHSGNVRRVNYATDALARCIQELNDTHVL